MGVRELVKNNGLRLMSLMVLGILSALALSGCAVTTTPETTTAPLTDDFESDIELEVVLTVNGQQFVLSDLAARPTSELEVFEPFAQKDTSFEVIDFGQLLLDSGFELEDRVETIALNDYRYEDSLVNFVNNKALLALSENGEDIPISKGGPVRIVFDEESDYYNFLDAWNWSLSVIEIAKD